MQSQRILQQTARRLAATSKNGSPLAMTKFARPAVALTQSRQASINSQDATQISADSGYQILANQRLNRPVSPHLSIYKPQITWIGSSLNRITGLALSGPLYIFGILYLVAPALGLQVTSAAMAAGFAKWPVVAKVGAKMLAALPFTYHSLNGLRHLVWDTGAWFANKTVQQTGWAVVGLSVVSALGLAAFV